jgi:hypothetical protein
LFARLLGTKNQGLLKDKTSLPSSQWRATLAFSRLTHSIRQPDGGPIMSRSGDVWAGGRRATAREGCRDVLASSREPGRTSDGSIDYDLYRTLARRLRQDFVAQTTSSLARQAVRASLLLAALIVPLPDNRRPQTSRVRSGTFRSQR